MNGGQKVSTRCGVGRIFHIFVFLMLAFMSHQAAAQSSVLIDATRPENILEYAKGFGIAELGRDSRGVPQFPDEWKARDTAYIFTDASKT